jgi:hypothetical protein
MPTPSCSDRGKGHGRGLHARVCCLSRRSMLLRRVWGFGECGPNTRLSRGSRAWPRSCVSFAALDRRRPDGEGRLGCAGSRLGHGGRQEGGQGSVGRRHPACFDRPLRAPALRPLAVLAAQRRSWRDSTRRDVVPFFWWSVSLSREKGFFVIVAIAGALGAMGHCLRSYFRYVGERNLLWNWTLSYFLIPFVGAIIGTLVFILLRAGLITGGGVAQSDPFGFAAVAALVGLFPSAGLGEAQADLRDDLRDASSGRQVGDLLGGHRSRYRRLQTI